MLSLCGCTSASSASGIAGGHAFVAFARTGSFDQPTRTAFVRTPAYFLFLGILGIQGFHLLEHVVQVVQRYSLGIANGNGLVGSVADTEPVHLVYNAAYFGLLVAAYLTLGLHRTPAVFGGAVRWLL